MHSTAQETARGTTGRDTKSRTAFCRIQVYTACSTRVNCTWCQCRQNAVTMASIICICTVGMFQLKVPADVESILLGIYQAVETSCSRNVGTEQKHFCICCWMILAPRNKWFLKHTKVIPWMPSCSVLYIHTYLHTLLQLPKRVFRLQGY